MIGMTLASLLLGLTEAMSLRRTTSIPAHMRSMKSARTYFYCNGIRKLKFHQDRSEEPIPILFRCAA